MYRGAYAAASASSYLVGDGNKSGRRVIVDGGCTKHIVASISMLTTITDSSPRASVRVANNELLPVIAVGTVIAYVYAVRTKMIGGVRKQMKVRMPIKLTSVYVVPGMAASLFSCKHGFEFNQIGTELNDKLCLTLPTGERVPFIEQGNRYAVNFYEEEEQVLAVQDGLDQG